MIIECKHIHEVLTKQDDVWDEEGTTTILVGKEGKPPDIAEAHRVPDTGEDKLGPGAPVASGYLLLHDT